jgi:hypothetical protein
VAAVVALATIVSGGTVLGQSPTAQQQIDEAYTAAILENTTEEYFLTPLVEFLPAADGIPTPLDFNGYIAGAEGHLTYAADIHRYMRALANASPRVEVRTMGTSEEGRERLLVFISSEENIADLDRFREISARLADPRNLSEDEAEQLIAEGIPFYWAVGGLHSPETGSPEMMMELAYRLAVEERELFQEIRDNSIVMLTPVIEVDGRERIVDIMRYRAAYPDKPAPPLVYWGKYVMHDNNRDGVGMALSLSRQAVAAFMEYHPVVMHDLHESVPFLYIMSGHGPFNPWLDPIVTEEWTEMAWVEVRKMNEWNVPGVWTHDFWDGWATNYMVYAAMGRNAIGRFYETFGNSSPETREREVGGQARRAWFRMNPPTGKVMWSLRNNTNLMQSALLVGMNNVANSKERFLESFYVKSRRATDKATTEGPAAWAIPSDQDRPVLTARLVNLLRSHGVEVHRTDESITIDAEAGPEQPAVETEFPAGTYLVRLDQPYSRLADMLLDYQYYNPEDPRPYDDTGWSLGPTFNVDTYRIVDTTVLDAAMEQLGADVLPPGGVRGRGTAAFLVNATGEPELAMLRFRLAEVPMRAAEEPFEDGERSFAAGTFIIAADAAPDLRSRLDALGRELGIEIAAIATEPDVPAHPVSVPRVALMHNWSRTQGEGWVRAALDEMEIPYDYISPQDLRGDRELSESWDVIIVGPGIGSFSSLLNGSPTPEPVPYETSDLTPNLGHIASTADTRQGMGYQGMVHLQRFLEDGGLLVTLTNSSSFVVDSGLTPFVAIDSTPPDLQARGAIFNAEVTDPASPIVYGYQDEPAVYFSSAPLLRVALAGGGFGGGGGGGDQAPPSGRRGEDMIPGRRPLEEPEEAEEEVVDEPWTDVDNLFREDDPRIIAMLPDPSTLPRTVMRFAEKPGDLLVSGMLGNGRSLAARPAIIDAPVGNGHVVMFAINPMWRHQTWGQFGLVLNAILHHDALDVGRVDPESATEMESR